MLVLPEKKEVQSAEEFSNPYVDYYRNLFNFSARYNYALTEAAYQGFVTFLNMREGSFQKIDNAIRSAFDTSLRELLSKENFASSVADCVNSWAAVMEASGLNNLMRTETDIKSYESMVLEPIRKTINRTPSEEIELGGRLNLLHYKSKSPPTQKTPILVIYSLISRHYLLDLLPKVSVIRNLQEQGFDIFSTHWAAPSSYDKDLSLENYIEDYVEKAISKIKELTGCDKVTLLGYCWGGLFSLIYTALHPENVRNLILQATPIDVEKGRNVVENWTAHLDADNLVRACGNVPGGLVDLAFALRNPAETILKYLRYFIEPRSLAEIQQFFAIETWLYDSPAIIGEVYRQVVDQVYEKNLLIKNKMKLGSELVNLSNISVPLLDIVGKGDDLVPPVSSTSILDVVSSKDKRLLEFPSGHVGMFVSTSAHEKLWPEVGKWLSQRS